jgi:hypothetical protein
MLGLQSSERSTSGLPDGNFSYQNSRFGYILEGLGLENVCIFYVHLKYLTDLHMVYFITILYMLLSFGIFYARFGMLQQDKSGNPGQLFTLI